METMIYTFEDEQLGKEITVQVVRKAIVRDLQHLVSNHQAGPDSEYPSVGRKDINGDEVTQEQRDADLLEIQDVITKFTDDDLFKELMNQIVEQQPRKKNHSFSKGRVNNIFQFHSFGAYWEDHYGTMTPAIRSRALGDYTLEIVYEEYIIKY